MLVSKTEAARFRVLRGEGGSEFDSRESCCRPAELESEATRSRVSLILLLFRNLCEGLTGLLSSLPSSEPCSVICMVDFVYLLGILMNVTMGDGGRNDIGSNVRLANILAAADARWLRPILCCQYRIVGVNSEDWSPLAPVKPLFLCMAMENGPLRFHIDRSRSSGNYCFLLSGCLVAPGLTLLCSPVIKSGPG